MRRAALLALTIGCFLAACSSADRPTAGTDPSPSPSLVSVEGLGDCGTNLAHDDLKAIRSAMTDIQYNLPYIRELMAKALRGKTTYRQPLGQGVGGGYSRLPIRSAFGQSADVIAHSRRGLAQVLGNLCSESERSLLAPDGWVPLESGSDRFHVSLYHPGDWEPIYGTRVGGPAGFVQIDAAQGRKSWSAKRICRSAAQHKLEPYGAHPKTVRARVAGRDACFIIPSDDQVGSKHLSALFVRYPRGVKVSGHRYGFLTIYADATHIQRIARTIRFTF